MINFGNVLITGGAGFLGSQLTLKLMEDSQHIWVIDDLSTGRIESLPSSPKLTFIKGSLLDETLLKPILPDIDYIFHFACANLVHSVDNIERDFTTNLFGGFKLLQYAKKYCTSLKRFIYASTASIYGQASQLPTEESDYSIKLPYAASKFSAEHYMHVFHHMYHIPITTLRFSNVYGPGQLISNPYCGVVAKFFDAALEKQALHIFGDGRQTRDFTFVDDALEATLIAALHPKALGEVYNVGTGVETSVNEIAEKIKAVANYKGEIKYLPKRPVDIIQRRSVSIKHIKDELDWHPETTLAEGLHKTYRWLLGGKGHANLSRDD